MSTQFQQWRCLHNFSSGGVYTISAVEVSTQFQQWRVLHNFSSGGVYTISAVGVSTQFQQWGCLHNFSIWGVYTILVVEESTEFQNMWGLHNFKKWKSKKGVTPKGRDFRGKLNGIYSVSLSLWFPATINRPRKVIFSEFQVVFAVSFFVGNQPV